LISGFPAQHVIADKGFDSNRFRTHLAERAIAAVIPCNRSRAQSIPYDPHLYKERHLVECFIGKLKHFRRVATRYDKTAVAFLAFVSIASIMVWLR